ncbi:sn-glycerol-3-phosphate ABC transporter ATP-binding protein UgpC [Labrys sp. ZIDIC5]|uniref:ABC transporter ATP-binding protein n=1 Tax=Labrys sedimenti TaxID=3106036 RepID=UPI002ACA2500|nr:sn-glycerol-3-phosphate ABC transporter ATP-binding protein UgpC [Labrys sp. ZIDIC5]MDZ5448524.1 sn-glycerol-3-phosphate ABC transporter ATP-binding protein UgpC [Labrys sp. ZIDIC5]
MAAISFSQVSKAYADGHLAVNKLDLDISDGEFLVLVGPSGCGKSTALRMIAGLETITGGTLSIGAEVANDLSPRERNVAMIFQSYALYPHLSVADNVGFALKVRGERREVIEEKVKAAAAMLELDKLLTRRPGQLSGGQRQRVAMGRAIVREPAAFLMDEPLSNLDARLRGQMRAEIARLQRASGVTTVYVTHDQVEAMTMGDRVAVMNGGVLQQLAPPRELYDRPVNLFVATFIGAPPINLLPGRLLRSGQGMEVALPGLVLPLPAAFVQERPGLAAAGDREVVVGIRPENLFVADGAAEALSARIAFQEDLGASLLIHVDLVEPGTGAKQKRAGLDELDESAPAVISTRMRISAPVSARRKAGDAVKVGLQADSLHFFDPASQLAIR